MKRRFRCTCGKVNQFEDAGGAAHTVKVRCGACRQVCRIDIPEVAKHSERQQRLDWIRDIVEKAGMFP